MGEVVIQLAKAAISVALGVESTFDLEQAIKNYPQLERNAAVFVTLTTGSDDRLRGCIGTLSAYRPLYEDIIANAKSAAFHDPRFSPLTPDEWSRVKVEVSILTEPKVLHYISIEDLKSKIKPQVDGVVLEHNGYRATYLPQVWEQLPQFDDFFTSLCTKAGLSQNCLEQHPEIKTYQDIKYKEK